MHILRCLGGTFPLPPAVAHLNNMLPPPHFFHGPFVAVDKLMELFYRLDLPDDAPPATGDGCDPTQFELAKSVHWVPNADREEDGPRSDHQNNHFRGRRGFKRRHGGRNHNHNRDSEEEVDTIVPPANDIYRNRQQKRVK